jgi:hypothetical protein
MLDEIRSMRQSGHMLRGIAADLNHRGHRTRRRAPGDLTK